MSCLGLCVALDDGQATKLLSLEGDDDALLEYIQEELEEAWGDGELEGAQFDKSWDAMHRSLTDGRLGYDNGTFPLNMCVLGGRRLFRGESYIVSYKLPEEVAKLAAALRDVDEQWMRDRYFTIDPKDYGAEIDESDWQYTWEWFEGVREFYISAAANRRHVIFTADQ